MRSVRKIKHFSTLSLGEYRALADEGEIQGTVRALLDACGIANFVTDASRTWTPNGRVGRPKVDKDYPDVTAILPPTGRALLIETKSAGGRLSAGQRRCHERLRAAGAIVLVPASIGQFAKQMIAEGIDHPLLKGLIR